MKTILNLVVLLRVGVNLVFGDYLPENIYGYNEKSGFEYPDHDYVEKPCPTEDLNCIRSFLAHNFGCSPVHVDASGPYTVKQLTMTVPLANASFTLSNYKLKGLNVGHIGEFYIDKKTDTLVLEVIFDQLILDSPQTTVTYYRKGKAPIEASDRTLTVLKYLSLTWTLRHMHDLHRATSYVYAYLGDPAVISTQGPGMQPEALAAMNALWMNHLPLAVNEAMIAQAPRYFDGYLETKVCKLPKHVLM